MTLLDTLQASLQLRDGGIEASHADAIVRLLADEFAPRLATKDEVDRLRAAVEELRAAADELRLAINGASSRPSRPPSYRSSADRWR